METFTAGSCIRFGWETFKKRPLFFIGAYLLFIIVVGVISAALNELGKNGGAIGFVMALIRFAVDLVAGVASLRFFLKAHDDVDHATLSDFLNWSPFWNYTGTAILYWAIIVCGLILIIVPGIIWSIMFGFALILAVDKNMTPIAALKESKRITYGHKWELLLLGLFSALIVVLGVVCLLVGILVAYPVITVAMVHAYRMLQQKASTPTAM